MAGLRVSNLLRSSAVGNPHVHYPSTRLTWPCRSCAALSQADILSCINGNTKFPDALEAAFRASPLAKKFDRPKNLKPAPPALKDHPAQQAIAILNDQNVPAPIMAAAKAKWGKEKTGGGGGGKRPTGRPAGKPGPPAKKGHAHNRALDDDEILLLPREAEAEAGRKFTVHNVEALSELMADDPRAAAAVAAVLNKDPKLAKYAEELDQDFGDGKKTPKADDKQQKKKENKKKP